MPEKSTFNDAARPGTPAAIQKSYPPGLSWQIPLPPKTVVDLFEASVKKFSGRPAVTFMGRTYTYRQLGEMSSAFAGHLQHQGIRAGDRVGICMPNNPYYLVAFYGALKAGATVVNVNPLSSDAEMTHLVKDSGVKVMVTINLPQIQPRVEALLATTPLQRVISGDFADLLPATRSGLLRTLNGSIRLAGTFWRKAQRRLTSFRDARGLPTLMPTAKGNTVTPLASMLRPRPGFTRPLISPHQGAVLQYTGGTTGTPKAAVLSHANLAANIRQTAAWFAPARREDHAEKTLAVLPFFHVFSMTVQMSLSLHMGDELVLMPPSAKVDIKAVLAALRDHKITIFAGVPDLYRRLTEEQIKSGYDLSRLRFCVSGAAPLPQQTWEDWKKATGIEIVEGYGLSETAPLVAANPLNGRKKINSIGLPIPLTEVRIADLEFPDRSQPVKVAGEICLRGPQIMQGYWNRPDETANVMDKDGYFHTGDVGYIDEDGYIFIVDRIKDMVIVNGFKAFPRHIEDAILQHDAVGEVIVLGVPDAEKGEAVKAFVVLKPGKSLSAEELAVFLKDKLTHYELPRAQNIIFRDALPKTQIGKPDRKALRAQEISPQNPPQPTIPPRP